VVWIDGSDFELELESVKAQARSPVAAPNKLEKGWFSRQGLSASCLHSCKRPMELSIMLAPGWQTSPPHWTAMPEGGPFYACSTEAS
jgi:hypothetical protein